MTAEKILKLIDDLKNATEEGKIRWNETADENEFRTVLNSGMIRVGQDAIYEEDLGSRRRGYILTILNSDARVVEEFVLWGGERYVRNPESSSRTKEVYEILGDKEYSSLAELYEIARRSARQGDSLLDAILAEVEGRGGAGKSR